MLLSHRKKFIYLKTVKTASTSVESFFERFCVPEHDEWQFEAFRKQSVTKAGIVGYRGLKRRNWFGLRQRWFDHMPANKVKNQLKKSLWDSYFKFCVIRNPFDKVISAFYFFQWMEKRGLHKMPVPIAENEIERFRNWVRVEIGERRRVLDRQCYTVDGRLCVDFVIRFENLTSDLREVCNRLDIPPDLEHLPRLIGQVRPKKIPIADYYDDSTRQVVEQVFDFELETFGYQFPE